MHAIDFVHRLSKRLILKEPDLSKEGRCICCGQFRPITPNYACEGCHFLFQSTGLRFGSVGARFIFTENAIEIYLPNKHTCRLSFDDPTVRVFNIDKHDKVFLKRITFFEDEPYVALSTANATPSFDQLWVNHDPNYVRMSINPVKTWEKIVWEYNSDIVRRLLSAAFTKVEIAILNRNVVRQGDIEKDKDKMPGIAEKLAAIDLDVPESDMYAKEFDVYRALI